MIGNELTKALGAKTYVHKPLIVSMMEKVPTAAHPPSPFATVEVLSRLATVAIRVHPAKNPSSPLPRDG